MPWGITGYCGSLAGDERLKNVGKNASRELQTVHGGASDQASRGARRRNKDAVRRD